jgi:hypothetical protein
LPGLRDAGVRRLLWLCVLVEAFVFAYSYAERTVVLTGGDDWLMYESYARDIALGDVFQTGLGAYYNQPFVAQSRYAIGDPPPPLPVSPSRTGY